LSAGRQGIDRIPLRVRGARLPALDELLYMAFPLLFRFGARQVFRRAPGSAMRRRVLARTTRLSYEAQNRGDRRFVVLPYSEQAELRNVPISGGGEKVAGVGDSYRGRDGARRLLDDWTEPWETTRFEPIELLDAGDGRLLVRSHLVTRGKGSGVEVREPLAQLIVFRDGEIVEQRNWLGSWDDGLAAIGAEPELGPQSSAAA
jgi:ketosteroid isomerase-like protein